MSDFDMEELLAATGTDGTGSSSGGKKDQKKPGRYRGPRLKMARLPATLQLGPKFGEDFTGQLCLFPSQIHSCSILLPSLVAVGKDARIYFNDGTPTVIVGQIVTCVPVVRTILSANPVRFLATLGPNAKGEFIRMPLREFFANLGG